MLANRRSPQRIGQGVTMTTGNGGTAQPQAQPQATAPQLNILAQYIKDFSFENPNSPQSLVTSGQNPAINIQVNVSANQLQDNNIEVVLKIDGKADTAGTTLFAFELAYAGVFRILNVPDDSMHPIVMIECPRLLFPFSRQIIATTVSNGGFPPLMLDPVDFVGLYRQSVAQAASPTAQT
jgi:preprotein translocase subunit SecB